jgi:hypothetical protein
MTAFDELVDDLFADDNLAVAATYTPPGGGTSVACSVILSAEDRDINFNGGRQIAQGRMIDLRRSEISAPRKGAAIVIDDETFQIAADPEADDADRLIWRCRVVPAVTPFASLDFSQTLATTAAAAI